MGLLAVNNSHKYFRLTHFQLFLCVLIHSNRNSITRSINNIFMFIFTCGIRTTTSIFIFVCTRGTSTFAISFIKKFVYPVPWSQSIRIMICPLALFIFSILSHSSVIKILRLLSIVLSTNLMEEIKQGVYCDIWSVNYQLVQNTISCINLTVRQICASQNPKLHSSYIKLLLFKRPLHIFHSRYMPWYNLQLLFPIFLQFLLFFVCVWALLWSRIGLVNPSKSFLLHSKTL